MVGSQGQREAFPSVSDGGQSYSPRSPQPWGWVTSLARHTIAYFTSSSLGPHGILPLPPDDASLALLLREVTHCPAPQDCHLVAFPRSRPLPTVFSGTPPKHEHVSCPLAQASRGPNNLDTGSFGTPRAPWAGTLLRGTRMAAPSSHQVTLCPHLLKSALVHTAVRVGVSTGPRPRSPHVCTGARLGSSLCSVRRGGKAQLRGGAGRHS